MLATVLNDNVVHIASAVAFMVLGLLLGVNSFHLEARVVHHLWLGIGMATALTLGLVLCVRFGVCARVLGATRRLPIAALRRPDLLDRAREVDEQLAHFMFRRTTVFLCCFLLHLGGRLMGAVEAWIILFALGTPVGLDGAVFIIAVIHVLVNLAFCFVPNQLGVQEAAAYLLFSAVGLPPPVAVALSLVRRIRGFFWIGVGLVMLMLSRRGSAGVTPPLGS